MNSYEKSRTTKILEVIGLLIILIGIGWATFLWTGSAGSEGERAFAINSGLLVSISSVIVFAFAKIIDLLAQIEWNQRSAADGKSDSTEV